MSHRIGRWVRWTMVTVVKPIIVVWIMVEGTPNVIRAIGSAAAQVVKAMK